MPTSNGLAEAYKYVTTQVIVLQKHTTLPRVPERIRRNYSRDKRKRHRNSETLCPMYKCFPYTAQEDGKSYTLRYQVPSPQSSPVLESSDVVESWTKVPHTEEAATVPLSNETYCDSHGVEALSRQLKEP